jgi:hypothetical protein
MLAELDHGGRFKRGLMTQPQHPLELLIYAFVPKSNVSPKVSLHTYSVITAHHQVMLRDEEGWIKGGHQTAMSHPHVADFLEFISDLAKGKRQMWPQTFDMQTTH